MPKGKGTLSGVIVHDLQPRYGYTNEGYIGRYSVRVLEKEEIDLAASESSSNRQTLVEWNWNNAEVRTNADGTIAPDRGQRARSGAPTPQPNTSWTTSTTDSRPAPG